MKTKQPIKLNAFIKRYQQYIEKYKNPSKITSRTKFLQPYKKYLQSLYPNKKLLEIVYIKINNLSDEDILCPVCKKKDRKYYTISKGYNLTCSQSCSTTLINKQRDKEIYLKQSNSLKKTFINDRENILTKRKESRKKNKTLSESDIAKKAYKLLNKETKEKIKNAPIIARKKDPEKTKKIYLDIAKKLLNDIDENGNNHYDRVHIKKLNDIDENGNNWYKRRDIRNYEKGIWTNPEDMCDFERYSYLCRKITRNQPIHLLENFELRGHANQGKYHLDHKYSIKEGFKNNIPPFIIGSMHNLEMILGRNNLKKSAKCTISKESLLDNFYK